MAIIAPHLSVGIAQQERLTATQGRSEMVIGKVIQIPPTCISQLVRGHRLGMWLRLGRLIAEETLFTVDPLVALCISDHPSHAPQLFSREPAGLRLTLSTDSHSTSGSTLISQQPDGIRQHFHLDDGGIRSRFAFGRHKREFLSQRIEEASMTTVCRAPNTVVAV